MNPIGGRRAGLAGPIESMIQMPPKPCTRREGGFVGDPERSQGRASEAPRGAWVSPTLKQLETQLVMRQYRGFIR